MAAKRTLQDGLQGARNQGSKEMLLQGGTDIDAARALAIGLINRVVAPPDLMVEARKFAAEIVINNTFAVGLTKKAVNHCVEIMGMREALMAALETDIEADAKNRAKTGSSRSLWLIDKRRRGQSNYARS